MVLLIEPRRRCAGPFSLLQERDGRLRDRDVLRHVLETVVRRCMAERLIGCEGFCCRCQSDQSRREPPKWGAARAGIDKSQRTDGTFSQDDFSYDKEKGHQPCCISTFIPLTTVRTSLARDEIMYVWATPLVAAASKPH